MSSTLFTFQRFEPRCAEKGDIAHMRCRPCSSHCTCNSNHGSYSGQPSSCRAQRSSCNLSDGLLPALLSTFGKSKLQLDRKVSADSVIDNSRNSCVCLRQTVPKVPTIEITTMRIPGCRSRSVGCRLRQQHCLRRTLVSG